MLTVTKLAQSCGLSRGAVLYYESIGLLPSAARSPSNYRRYGEKDLRRLRQICVYRDAGLKLGDIRALLERPANDATAILKRRMAELSAEIEALREHQRSILKLMGNSEYLRRNKTMTKEKW